MTTLLEYYRRDFTTLSVDRQGEVRSETGDNAQIQVRAHYEFDANAKFVSYYVAKHGNYLQIAASLISGTPTLLETYFTDWEVRTGFPGEQSICSKDLRFTGRIFIYLENELTEGEADSVTQFGVERGLSVLCRGPRYAAARSALEVPLAFVSHEWSDRETIARPLYNALFKFACPVWYSEYSLRVGDSLRESIEHGLKTCQRCILLLTPRFLAGAGWTKTEFNAIFTREMIESKTPNAKKRILPVWYEVSQQQVFDYSPTLADRLALQWSEGVDEVARKLAREIKS